MHGSSKDFFRMHRQKIHFAFTNLGMNDLNNCRLRICADDSVDQSLELKIHR